jgi:hypothetical protein
VGLGEEEKKEKFSRGKKKPTKDGHAELEGVSTNQECHRKPPVMETFAVKDGEDYSIDWKSMELSLRKTQVSIREAHEKGKRGPECDSFIDLSKEWWSAFVTVSPDRASRSRCHF